MTFSFPDHLSLLAAFLDRRRQITDDIEGRLLNVQGKATSQSRDRTYVERVISSCFFDTPGLPHTLSGLRGQLLSAHLLDGFEPVRLEHRSDQLDAVALVLRAYDHWDRHRWPGRNGRLALAQALYAVFILQQLELLSLRVWDDGNASAGDRLREVQSLLDKLNGTTGSAVFVRDARWLIQTAQGLLTRHLQPYFRIAELISSSFTESDRLEIHKAGLRLGGGHLRSQLRYRAGETGRTADDPEVLAITRNSSSMDAALLVSDLVPLLEAYKEACVGSVPGQRLDLADAIIQGVSADPGLFLTRLDILGPCTMIEEVFVERAGSTPRYTPAGHTYLARLTRYRQLISDLAQPLREDALTIATRVSVYSPFGMAYGFCADLLSNMVLDALLSHASFDLSLEDFFVSEGQIESKALRSSAWAKLSTPGGEREHVDHSVEWAGEVLQRTVDALQARAARRDASNASVHRGGRLFVIPDCVSRESVPGGLLPDGTVSAQEHCVTSDLQRALASGATAFPKSQILLDRKEGRFLASAEVDGKWFGVSKVLLTTCICQGKDAVIADVPEPVIEVLQLTCPELVLVLPGC